MFVRPGNWVALPSGAIGIVERVTRSAAEVAGRGFWASIRLDLLTPAEAPIPDSDSAATSGLDGVALA